MPDDLPPPPANWRPILFASISLVVGVVLASWYQVEAVRHGTPMGYAEAVRITLSPRRLLFDGVGGCIEAVLVLIAMRCWWRYWRHGRTPAERFVYYVTRTGGAATGAALTGLIANFLGSLAKEPFSIGLLLVTLLIGASVAISVSFPASYAAGRAAARSQFPP